jgi:hypothetical protein
VVPALASIHDTVWYSDRQLVAVHVIGLELAEEILTILYREGHNNAGLMMCQQAGDAT